MRATQPPSASATIGAVTWGRLYFAVQAAAGAAWWVAVFALPAVRTATLGTLDFRIVAALDIPFFVIASALVACGVRKAVWIAAPWTVLVAIGMVGYATVTATAGWGALLMVAAAAGSTAAAVVLLLGRVPSEWLLIGPFRFRPAAEASARTLVSKTTLQTLVFSATFLVALPAIIVGLEWRWGLHLALPPAVRVGGAVLFVAAFALSTWSSTAMAVQGAGTPLPSSTPRRLVITGPYRFVRNPMAIGGIAQGVAIGLMVGSWLVIVYALSGSLVWNALVRPLEEADLEERFGSAFRTYRDRVSCWIPRRPLIASAG
ncbi:isoprenylcysteine carboxylmethyltransferase family protein [Microbacterium sp. KKR3/1]|uniref:methyltransferase family protein n=1 Tax=Microbacterium sp. KKR3/1 TaxID=2904241 RepID=UPI001E516A33|nr:isoprenylcysteine carboxylmethyltransferase family protein [Microbacterium sp. KKR3/1]MCE0509539.1 isoprenylcysteine carboxylmethyltransferase family protein [Microbacterium sp. KKR3/1]